MCRRDNDIMHCVENDSIFGVIIVIRHTDPQTQCVTMFHKQNGHLRDENVCWSSLLRDRRNNNNNI